MNLTMQQPMSYPFYMSSPRYPYSIPWPSNPFHYPSPSYQTSPSLSSVSYPVPFILSQQPRPYLPPKPLPSFSSYTNTRYNHLKQSTSHINRHRSTDTSLHSQRYTIPNYQYRPLRTKSVSDFQQLSQQNSTHLFKAHSWHSINHLHQPNFNINHEKQMSLIHENHHHHHQRSPKRKKKSHRKPLSSSSPLLPPKQIPEQGIVRISTLDEMPIMNNPLYQDNLLNSTRNQKNKKSIQKNSSKQPSPASTTSSHSSFQKRLNGSLRNDPLIIAAMEDLRQLQRTSSQSTILTPHQRDLSRDSLCSNSTHHSSSSISRNHSQSSFTSLERLEIRNLIKTLKTKGLQTVNIPFQLSPNPPPPLSSEQNSIKKSSFISINKPSKKSSITEELDREFNKLRSSNPNQDLIYVKPSLIQKQKQPIPPLPTFDELLNKVQIQTFEEKTYENPLISIPVPQSSPILCSTEIKPDYAIPIKSFPEVNLRSTKKDEQIRSFSFCKPINDIINETHATRPLSMFNWFQYGLTNPFPTTFQPHSNNENNYDKSLVKENIYASDIDIHVPLSNEKDYLNNQTLMTDYLSDYKQTTITTTNSSILNDFSRLFTRFGNHHKHEQKSKLKSKLHKNNQNLRCSIM